MKQSTRLLISNEVHEPMHIVYSRAIPLTIEDEGSQVLLNGNLVHPDWFKEGLANIICARFRTSFTYDFDFLDLFLQNWDGTIPPSAHILKGDTNVSYFVYTLFVTYYFQIAGMDWSDWQYPELQCDLEMLVAASCLQPITVQAKQLVEKAEKAVRSAPQLEYQPLNQGTQTDFDSILEFLREWQTQSGLNPALPLRLLHRFYGDENLQGGVIRDPLQGNKVVGLNIFQQHP